jgi:hypothetical protein
MLRYLAVFFILISSATAQDLDPDIWEAITKATANVSMPLAAHQDIQRILAEAKKEAELRVHRAKMKAEKK